MDNLAHTLVGLALAATALGRRTPLAPAALVIGANLPDADGVAYLAGSDAGLLCRRGWTHGILAIAVEPWLLAGLLLAWDRLWRRRRDPAAEPARAIPLVLVSLVAIVTHPVLDWLNTYGMRWLMPFDGRWFYGDALYIIDPWLWLGLGAALYLGRRRSWPGEAGYALVAAAAAAVVLFPPRGGAPAGLRAAWLAGLALVVAARLALGPCRSRTGRERLAAAGLAVVAAYASAMLGLAAAGRGFVRSEIERRGLGPAGRLMVGPLPADPLGWDVLAEVPGGYRWGTLRWGPAPRLELAPARIATPPPGPLVAAARAAPEVRGLVNWARFPWYVVEPSAGGGADVWIMDARYARRPARGFGGALVHVE